MIDWSLLVIPAFCLFMAWIAACAYVSNNEAIHQERGRMRRLSEWYAASSAAWAVWWVALSAGSLILIIIHYYKVTHHE